MLTGIVDTSPTSIVAMRSIFEQDWWLDAVAPGRWQRQIISRHGKVIAEFPYMIERRKGWRGITMPPLTPTLGPTILAPGTQARPALSSEKFVLDEALRTLQGLDFVDYSFSPKVSFGLSLTWSGLPTFVAYTYRIPPQPSLHDVWRGVSKKRRSLIRRTAGRMAIEVGSATHDYLNMAENYFHSRSLALPYSHDVAERLIEECAKKKVGKWFAAVRADGAVLAAIYLVEDAEQVYYLLGTRNIHHPDPGAMSFLIWGSIQYAIDRGKGFDFVGTCLPNVERFFRSYGATPTPYLTTEFRSRRYRAMHSLRRFF